MPSLPGTFVRTVRERATVQAVAALVLLVVFLRFVGDEPWPVVGRFAALLTTLVAFGALADAPNVDDRYLAILCGFVVAAVAVFVPDAIVEGETLGVTVVGLAVGGWLVADGLAALASGRSASERSEAFDDVDSGEFFFEMQLFRVVANQLRERPQTRAELAAACDLTESRVQTALDRLESTGSAHPVAETADGETRWAFDESSVGARAFVDATAGSAMRRLSLPFREILALRR
ncbi:hypothetical protein [Halogranum rubrum]|uniref:Uncharacterized protein n=1 Tax=Halogranum salarium B-1 TaxID=1210908 RepID=J3JI83_9EURY|nr:hypothetical protein [Halogranum salarium]EJN61626.1 hypothetical protein HSB1_06670 [Halogranum salarium B-1]